MSAHYVRGVVLAAGLWVGPPTASPLVDLCLPDSQPRVCMDSQLWCHQAWEHGWQTLLMPPGSSPTHCLDAGHLL